MRNEANEATTGGMNSAIELVRLERTPRNVRRFLQVSYGMYRNDPHWVAPLQMDLEKVFSEENPFFEHAQMDLWVARCAGRDVGRIAAIEDRLFNERQEVPAAFFGFYEALEAPEISQALFATVFHWARARRFTRVLGPMNPSGNDECGLLVKGHGADPVFMMPYNPEFYADRIEAAGFRKAKDLLAFHIDLAHSPTNRLARVADRLQKRRGDVTFRPIRRRTLRADLVKVKEVYNDAWEENWGFAPMTDGEIDFMAERLKLLLLEGLVWLAETPAEPVGFLLALPDFNQAIKPLRGRLWTPALLRFLPYLLGWKRPSTVRVLVLGVKERFRNRGIEAAMLAEGLKTGARVGFKDCEASWVLEDNEKVVRVIELFGGTPYKVYRIYETRLEPS
jgi:ribosomal protein S18 acetylase RimI-like enzyme